MRESKGNMFSQKPCDAIVITTNGFRQQNGNAVMGRGCAYQAANRWPVLPSLLGNKLEDDDNHVHHLMDDAKTGKAIVSFPVKPAIGICESQRDIDTCVVSHWRHKVTVGKVVPGFACVAVPELIARSATELLHLTNENQWEDVVCPRFGCGNGELRWDDVKKLVEPILDDRFIIMTF